MDTKKKDKMNGGRKCGNCLMIEDMNNKLKDCAQCKLIAYCDKACQADHWKKHKALCIPVKDRSLSNNQSAPISPNDDGEVCVNKCVICLEMIQPSKSCTLPCEHIFHSSCVSDLRSASDEGSQTCPLCRRDLPPGPEQNYIEGLRLSYSLMGKRNLTKKQKAVMVQAFGLFSCAAEEGHASAQYQLGSSYDVGAGVGKNDEKAVEWWLKSAEQGDPRAQSHLGFAYRSGKGVAQSYEQSYQWFMKAALQEDCDAQCSLGFAYFKGNGVKKDSKKSVDWFLKAAEQGDYEAQGALGVAFASGEGIEKSLEKAVYWYHKASEQGDQTATYNLAVLWAERQDLVRATDYFLKAAEKGMANAQYNVAISYFNGDGIERDEKRAILWLRKAAKQGHPEAPATLAHILAEGKKGSSSPVSSSEMKCLKAKQSGGVTVSLAQAEELSRRKTIKQVLSSRPTQLQDMIDSMVDWEILRNDLATIEYVFQELRKRENGSFVTEHWFSGSETHGWCLVGMKYPKHRVRRYASAKVSKESNVVFYHAQEAEFNLKQHRSVTLSFCGTKKKNIVKLFEKAGATVECIIRREAEFIQVDFERMTTTPASSEPGVFKNVDAIIKARNTPTIDNIDSIQQAFVVSPDGSGEVCFEFQSTFMNVNTI